jgi:Ca-activated chloride channel family protein
MTKLMRCPYCGLLQDEPSGVKTCARCGGALEYESQPPGQKTYIQVQMELDQVAAPPDRNLERYLLVTVRTPREVPSEEAAPTDAGRPPLNFTAVLDVSGSMRGEKLRQAKAAVLQAVQYLRPGDVFSLVTFSNQIFVPFDPSPVNDGTYQAVQEALETISAGGMTALSQGLETGLEKARTHLQDTNLALLLSDGQANVGVTDLEMIGQQAYQARQGNILVSCLGIGMDYNEALLAEVANQGGGRYYHVQHAHQIPAYLAGELGEAAMLAARDARLHLDLPQGATLIPLSAVYPVQQVDGEAVVTVGDMPCDIELEIPLRLALLGQPSGTRLSIQGRLAFRSPAGNALECPLNRVTIRFLQSGAFQLREGVVMPVAERVFAQMKASSVLGLARTLSHKPAEASQQTRSHLDRLRAYADLLGKERADAEMGQAEAQLHALADKPAAAKNIFSQSYRAMRGTKDFDK